MAELLQLVVDIAVLGQRPERALERRDDDLDRAVLERLLDGHSLQPVKKVLLREAFRGLVLVRREGLEGLCHGFRHVQNRRVRGGSGRGGRGLCDACRHEDDALGLAARESEVVTDARDESVDLVELLKNRRHL